MLNLIKPEKLNRGDKIATVSLSWGGAGDKDLLWRYEQGKERLKELFGLEVVEMKHTLKGSDYIYKHPEKRAEDLMQAFADPSIKGIIACIGGIDSIRMLPYIDFDLIRDNPKIFMRYSDSTVTHFMCLKAGISSFYGASVLTDFAENVSMPEYSIEWIKKVLFQNQTIGEIQTSNTWTGERLEWTIENKNVTRNFIKNTGYELLQGQKTVSGRLIGGYLEVIDMMKGTPLFPELHCFDDSILFLETSEEFPPVWMVETSLRSYGIMGILERINGIIFGKPQENKYYEEYKRVILQVVKEFGREDLPILYNASFGHNEPKCILPYGALTEINCDKPGLSIIENGVI
ncbi:S66 family peptidase [Terrilactibacillus laevilacticus]|uniref:S66 peptidase family protein n=1 Tax=Terrilactibacillus laevilacticus TaxID=1380157 RepID=A0ABW5PSJ1_9BACI|nr:S66 peptidase family protein [Terrilactibacillus laevilacticus]